MTLPTFPTLPGIGLPKKSPIWSTVKQPSIGGQESRFAQWSYPKYHYEYPFEFLRDFSGYTEFDSLVAFYNSVNGSAGFWQYTDPKDNLIVNQPLATGDGTTTAFQLVRSKGGFTEPVFLPTAISLTRSDFLGSTLMYPTARTNYVRNPRAEGAIAGTPGTTPTYWSVSPATNRQIVGTGTVGGVSYVDIRIYGTQPGSGTQLAISLYLDGANTTVTVGNYTFTASAWVQVVAGALPSGGSLELHIGEYGTGTSYFPGTPVSSPGTWQRTSTTTTITDPTITSADAMVWVYCTGGQTFDFTLRVGGPQLELGSTATSLILPPSGSPAVTTITDYGLLSNGVIVMASAPASGASIQWTGTYNWLCRFDDDSIDFEAIADGFWSLGSLKFSTEKL